MKINPSIFRSYDIRGVYPEQLDEKIAYRIGKSFVELIKAKRVVVGRDARLSSFSLFKALSNGITDYGASVYNLKEVPTECLYFAVGRYNFDAGIMITASHNPKEYNGFKLLKKKIDGFSMVRGDDLRDKVLRKEGFKKTKKKGKIKEKAILQDYIDFLFSLVHIKGIKCSKIVVDASNGVAGKVIPLIEKKLRLKIVPLNFELDGNFPAHPPNPLLEESKKGISEKVKKERADFGFIFDGDADRVFLIDEKGNFVRADITLLLLARYFLKKEPGAAIAYNLICSKAVPEFIKKWGGKPVKTKVGFVNVREKLLENNGLIGGELSGHYCFKDNFYGDSGFLAFLVLIKIISESGKKVSELVKELSLYFKSEELNFRTKEKEKILEIIKKKYSSGKQDYLDGVTVDYKDWWFNIRPSNTEPLLRLSIEAKTKELLEEKKKELTDLIRREK